ncbi:MAG TPA: flagellar hook-basal body complex protein FliE [Rhodospirillales bacterium]|nr:flagellar hook-basal body complex protein FliE [Rhodospirillales bacterium]
MSIAINSFAGAAAAYARARDHLAGVGAEDEALPAARGSRSSFADMVRSVIDGAVATGKESERLSMAAVGDGADVTQVVTAVAEAETVLNTVMAVRDRVIDAYKDVLRMPI